MSEFSSFHSEMGSFLPPDGARGGGGGPRLNLKRLIRLRAPLMIAVSLFFMIPLVSAVWLLTNVEYTSTGSIQFVSTITSNVFGGSQGGADDRNFPTYVSTQIGILLSNATFDRVMELAEIRALPIIEKQRDPKAFLASKIRAQLEGRSRLVKVSCTTPDPEVSRLLVSAMIDQYIESNSESGLLINQDARQKYNKELDAVLAEIDRQNSELQNLQEQLEAPTPGSGTGNSVPEQQLVTVQSLRLQLENSIQTMNSDLEDLKSLQERHAASPSGAVPEFEIESQVDINQSVVSAQKALDDVELELTIQSNTFRESHPKMVALVTRRNKQANALAQAKAKARGDILRHMVLKNEHELSNLTTQLEGVQKDIEHFEGLLKFEAERMKTAAVTQSNIEDLRGKIDANRKRRDKIDDELKNLSLQNRSPTYPELASAPNVPLTPDNSKRIKLSLMCVLMSCGLGAGVGLLRELTDEQIRTVQDVTGLTRLPILGAIPEISHDERLPKSAEPPMILADHPDSTTADELRRVLTRIVYPSDSAIEIHTFIVTSPTRRDGKTTIACNMAIGLAQANRRVLLVDISSRSPAVENAFGLHPAPGLGEILCDGIDPVALLRPTEFPNLFILGPGFRGDEFLAKLAARATTEIFEEFERTFDHVVIDTPPSLLMSEGKLLAPIVDGTVVVIGAGHSTRGMVSRCLRELEQTDAEIFGIVLNAQVPTRGGYLRQNQALFYSHRQDVVESPDGDDLPEMFVPDENEEESIPQLEILDDSPEDSEVSSTRES